MRPGPFGLLHLVTVALVLGLFLDALGPLPLHRLSPEAVAIASSAAWLGILGLSRRALPSRVAAPVPERGSRKTRPAVIGNCSRGARPWRSAPGGIR